MAFTNQALITVTVVYIVTLWCKRRVRIKDKKLALVYSLLAGRLFSANQSFSQTF